MAVRRDEAMDQLFAEFRAEVKADVSNQIDTVVLTSVSKGFVGKLGERLSTVEERTTMVASQVKLVENGQAALQVSLNQVLAVGSSGTTLLLVRAGSGRTVPLHAPVLPPRRVSRSLCRASPPSSRRL